MSTAVQCNEQRLDHRKAAHDEGAWVREASMPWSSTRRSELLGRLERAEARRWLATMCVGVGQGTALLLERP